jgi:hypothetical protein
MSVMSTDLKASARRVSDRETLWTSSIVMSAAAKTAAITRVRCLEQRLFDDCGQVRRRTDRATAEESVAVINGLRRSLGWLEIDLDGHWRWPE